MTKPYFPPTEPPEGFKELGKTPIGPLTNWKEKLNKPRIEIPWIVENMLVRGGLTMLVSEGGLGKSWMAAHVAALVSYGGYVHGEFEVKQKGNVLWYDNENGTEENDRRVQLMLSQKYHDSEHDVYMREVPEFQFKANPKGIQTMKRDIEEVQPELVIIDSVVSIFFGDKSESNSNDVREIMDAIVGVTKGMENPPAFLLLHHARKGGTDDTDRWPEYRGSSDLRSAVNFLITMRGRRDGKDQYVQFKWDKCRRGKQPEGVYEYSLVDKEIPNPNDPLDPRKVVEYVPSQTPKSPHESLLDTIVEVIDDYEGYEVPEGHLVPLVQERYPTPPSKPYINNALYRAIKNPKSGVARVRAEGKKLTYLYSLKGG